MFFFIQWFSWSCLYTCFWCYVWICLSICVTVSKCVCVWEFVGIYLDLNVLMSVVFFVCFVELPSILHALFVLSQHAAVKFEQQGIQSYNPYYHLSMSTAACYYPPLSHSHQISTKKRVEGVAVGGFVRIQFFLCVCACDFVWSLAQLSVCTITRW